MKNKPFTKIKSIIITLCFLLLSTNIYAGEADVVNVEVSKSGMNSFDFNVTVLHEDTGWKHYANKWEILDKSGTVIGTRILYHPHVSEQPFTRSLSGIEIPKNVNTVIVRAHDLIHNYGGKVITVELP